MRHAGNGTEAVAFRSVVLVSAAWPFRRTLVDKRRSAYAPAAWCFLGALTEAIREAWVVRHLASKPHSGQGVLSLTLHGLRHTFATLAVGQYAMTGRPVQCERKQLA
jgi:hypothetical protein